MAAKTFGTQFPSLEARVDNYIQLLNNGALRRGKALNLLGTIGSWTTQKPFLPAICRAHVQGSHLIAIVSDKNKINLAPMIGEEFQAIPRLWDITHLKRVQLPLHTDPIKRMYYTNFRKRNVGDTFNDILKFNEVQSRKVTHKF